jgi:hypothetical protein
VAPTGRRVSKRTSRVVHCYTINSSTKKSDDDNDVELLKYLLRTVIGVLFNSNQ